MKVSCYKPEEHPFMILALEISLAVTMDSGDADPKLFCPSGMRWPQDSIGSGQLGLTRVATIPTNAAVRYLVFVFYVLLFGICFLIKLVKNYYFL